MGVGDIEAGMRRARHWTGRLGIRVGLHRLGPDYAPVDLPAPYERVYFHHVRKTGGTSLIRSFLGLAGEDPVEVEHRLSKSLFGRTRSGEYVFAAGHRETIADGRYFFAFSHNPAHRVRLPPGTFTVTVLRDPASRVLSYYQYLRTGDTGDAAFRVRERERRMAEGGFDAFLARIPKEHLLRQLYTFSASFDVGEAAEVVSRCSAVIRCEDYDAGMRALVARIQLPLEVRRDRVTLPSDEILPERSYSYLREVLAPEYDLIARVDDVTTSP
jgi:hypothetical protein